MNRLALRIQRRFKAIHREKLTRQLARRRAARPRSARGVWGTVQGALRLRAFARIGGTAKVHPSLPHPRIQPSSPPVPASSAAHAPESSSSALRRAGLLQESRHGFEDLEVNDEVAQPTAGHLSFLDRAQNDTDAASDASSDKRAPGAEEARLMAIVSRFLAMAPKAQGCSAMAAQQPGAADERDNTAHARGAFTLRFLSSSCLTDLASVPAAWLRHCMCRQRRSPPCNFHCRP